MLLLQRPPSFPRSCWAAWTSWLKNTQETQNKTLYMSGCGQIVLLFSHLPHRLSLSLTASCVFSSAADSSLRHNGESEHFGTPLQSCRECARWFVELFYFQCLVQQALWKQLSVQSETPATSCMWCANGSQTRSSEAFFTGAQPELISLSLMVLRQRFLYVRQKTARDYLQVATFKRPSAQVLAASNGNENCKVFYWGPTWSHIFLIQAVMSG